MMVLKWEIDRVPWTKLRAAADPAQLSDALFALANATSESAAMEAYWHIDNVAVVQARVFEAAEYIVFPVLLMLRPNASIWTVRCALDLLVQITSGWIDPTELSINGQLLERIRQRAREGIASVYWCLRSDDTYTRDRAVEALDSIEDDRVRLAFILQRMVTTETDPNVRALALRVADNQGNPLLR